MLQKSCLVQLQSLPYRNGNDVAILIIDSLERIIARRTSSMQTYIFIYIWVFKETCKLIRLYAWPNFRGKQQKSIAMKFQECCFFSIRFETFYSAPKKITISFFVELFSFGCSSFYFFAFILLLWGIKKFMNMHNARSHKRKHATNAYVFLFSFLNILFKINLKFISS